MLHFNEGAVRVLAADMATMLADTDRALSSAFKGSGVLPEVLGATVPGGRSQKIYERIHGATGKILEGRREMLATIAQLEVVRSHSDCREVALGCPDQYIVEFFADAVDRSSPAVAATKQPIKAG